MITVPKTKTAVKALLVAERKAMREKQKQSAFMRKTLNIYNGMKKRATELGKELDFTVDQFRGWINANFKVFGTCTYCKDPVTRNSFTVDHYEPVSSGGSFDLHNLRLACKPCNFQKGALPGTKFFSLLFWIADNCNSEEAADIKRRLTIGGKWGFGR